jgi:hypothetical protein
MKNFLKRFALSVFFVIIIPSLSSASERDISSIFPRTHWAYDAIKQLDARGILQWYPDDYFKFNYPMTREEAAGMLYGVFSAVNWQKAGHEDADLLRRLAAEFEPELSVLGKKIVGLDERLRKLENDCGGWHISGEFQMDAKLSGDNDETGFHGVTSYLNGKDDLRVKRVRLNINKRIGQDTSFSARLGSRWGIVSDGMLWDNYYITTKLPYDITMRAGRMEIDWEYDLGLVWDNNSYYGGAIGEGFVFSKTWRIIDFYLAAIDYNHDTWTSRYRYGVAGDFLYGARFGVQFNEKFHAGLLGYWLRGRDYSASGPSVVRDASGGDYDVDTYGVHAEYDISPNASVKGVFYWQEQGMDMAAIYSGAAPGAPAYDESATAWKIILDVNQEALEFTSLWLEYGQIGNNFSFFDYKNQPYGPYGAGILYNQPGADHFRPINTYTTSVIGVFLNQWWGWSEKGMWHSFERYVRADYGTPGLGDAENITLGIGYRFSSGLNMELSYNMIDFGGGNPSGFSNGDDCLLLLSTYLAF